MDDLIGLDANSCPTGLPKPVTPYNHLQKDHILSHPFHNRLFVRPAVLEPDLESPETLSKANHLLAAAETAVARSR